MKRILTLALSALIIQLQAQTPSPLLSNPARLQEIKQKIQQQDKVALAALIQLQKKADSLLDMKPVSVMEKKMTPVSGNKHDYMSQAPYFWYDSSKPNGLPYLRRDGQRNPEIYKITDRTYLGKIDNACRILSLAWYFTATKNMQQKQACFFKHGL